MEKESESPSQHKRNYKLRQAWQSYKEFETFSHYDKSLPISEFIQQWRSSEAVAYLLSPLPSQLPAHVADDNVKADEESDVVHEDSDVDATADAHCAQAAGESDAIVVKIETAEELCNGDKDISRRSPESETSGSNGKIRSEGDLSIFCCKFCGLQLSCRKDLRQHHKQEHGPQKSEFSKKKSRTKGSILLTAPVVTSKEDSIFQCEYCAKSFNCVGGLSKHLKIHSGLKPYTCPVCGKSFLHSAHLKNHMRIHTGEKPYQCDACGKSFKQSQHLKDHKRSVHSTLHQCALCERTFASRQELASHRRLHSGERVYVCAVCERPFSRNQLLKDHMRIHTGERPFGCQLCDKTFIQKPHLTRHIRLYH